jgi:hypothetical protein
VTGFVDVRRPAVVAALAAVLAVCVLYAVAAPGRGREQFVDQAINRQTVEAMRGGAGYYDAMDAALRHYNGPAASVRAYRTPTAFVLWRWLPGAEGRWLAYVVMVAAVSLLLFGVTGQPWTVPAVALYLLRFGRPHNSLGWIDQYLLVELWAIPAIVGAVAAWRRGARRLALALAVLAASIREIAALLVVGGLLAAAAKRVSRRAAAVAAAGVAALVVAHSIAARSHLVEHGREIALLGTGGVDRMLGMAAPNLPHRVVVGAALWVLSWVWLVRHRDELLLFCGPLLLLPLTGLFVGRDYWGLLIVPLEIVWAADAIAELGSVAYDRLRRRVAGVAAPEPHGDDDARHAERAWRGGERPPP